MSDSKSKKENDDQPSKHSSRPRRSSVSKDKSEKKERERDRDTTDSTASDSHHETAPSKSKSPSATPLKESSQSSSELRGVPERPKTETPREDPRSNSQQQLRLNPTLTASTASVTTPTNDIGTSAKPIALPTSIPAHQHQPLKLNVAAKIFPRFPKLLLYNVTSLLSQLGAQDYQLTVSSLRYAEKDEDDTVWASSFDVIALLFSPNGPSTKSADSLRELMAADTDPFKFVSPLYLKTSASGTESVAFNGSKSKKLKNAIMSKNKQLKSSSPNPHMSSSQASKYRKNKDRDETGLTVQRSNTMKLASKSKSGTAGFDRTYIKTLQTAFFSEGPMSEETFCSIFEGKLGPIDIVRRYFLLFFSTLATGSSSAPSNLLTASTASVGSSGGSEGNRSIEGPLFLEKLSVLAGHRGIVEQMTLVFQAFDQYDLGILAADDLSVLLNQYATVAVNERKTVEESEAIKSEVLTLLDPKGEKKLNCKDFIQIAEKHPVVVNYLLPESIFALDQLSMKNMLADVTEVILSKETRALFSLMKSKELVEESVSYLKKVGKLIDAKVEIDAIDVAGNTLLHYACIGNLNQTLALLIQAGADVNQPYCSGITVLHSVCEKGDADMAKRLLEFGANLNAQDNYGKTPLFSLLKGSQNDGAVSISQLLQFLLDSGADATLEDQSGCTIFDQCVKYGLSEHFTRLLAKGADINHKSKNHFTPLLWAVAEDRHQCIKKLIKKGANIDAKTLLGATAVHLAAQRGHLTCLEQLFFQKANPLALDHRGCTPLHVAAEYGDVRCVKCLIEKAPAALKMMDAKRKLPLAYAKENRRTEAEALIHNGPLIKQTEFAKKILAHFRKGENDIVMGLLKKKDADIYAANENGTTLLHYASMQGRADILNLLIQRGANANTGNNRNTVPLHKAAQRGQLECQRILIAAGADINFQDEDDITPLHRALYEMGVVSEKIDAKDAKDKLKNITQCVLDLLGRPSIKVTLCDMDGLAPLSVAARYGLIDVLTVLLTGGAKLDHCSHNGWSSLHWACAGGHTETVRVLLEASALGEDGAKKFIDQETHSDKNKRADHAIHLAALGGHLSTVRLLMEHGATLTLLSAKGQHMMHLAALSGSVALVQNLLADAAITKALPLSSRDAQGNTVYHLAHTTEVLQLLLNEATKRGEKPAELEKNADGESALMFAAKSGHLQAVDFWLTYQGINQKNHDLTAKNAHGFTALELSALHGHFDVANRIKSQGSVFEVAVSSADIAFSTKEDPINPLYPVLASGTMSALVEFLCNPRMYHEAALDSLLLGYYPFISAVEFFRLVFAQNKQTKSDEIISGSLAVIRHWVRRYYRDFGCNNDLRTLLLSSTVENQQLDQSLRNYFKTLIIEQDEKYNSLAVQEVHYSALKGQSKSQAAFILSLDALQIAQQLCLVEQANFLVINYHEFQGQGWSKSKAEAVSPNILAFIRHFNKFTSLVITDILTADKKATRAKLIKQMIKVAQHCYELKNYNTVMEILSALETPSISRLKEVWAEVRKEESLEKYLNFIKDQFSPMRNYRTYRALVQQGMEKPDPLIPFIGVQLQDLLFVDEGNPNYVADTRQVNFEKLQMYSTVVLGILSLQGRKYDFAQNSLIISTLLNRNFILDEQEAYKLSLELEPRK